MSYTRLIALLLTLLTLTVSACGSSSKSNISSSNSTTSTTTSVAQPSPQTSSAETTSRLSNAEMVTKVNSICRRTKARVVSNSVPNVSGVTLANSAERLSRSAGYEAQESRELLALAGSATGEASLQQLAGSVQQVSNDLTAYASAVKAGSAQTFNNPLVKKVASDEEHVLVIASRVRLHDCAKFE